MENDSGTGHQKTADGGGGRFQCLGCEGRQSVEEKLGNGAGMAERYQEIKLVC